MISRKKDEKKTSEESINQVANPFVDINLELKVLRYLVFDNDFDNS